MSIIGEYVDCRDRLIAISNLDIPKAQKMAAYNSVMKPLYDRDREIVYNPDLSKSITKLEEFLRESLFDINIITDIKEYHDDSEEDYIIKLIVCLGRQRYESIMLKHHGKKISCKKNTLRRECIFLSNIILGICNDMKIKCIPFSFFNEVREHMAVIVELDKDNRYLIDCTYQQFFLLGENLPDRHVTKELTTEGPLIGHTVLTSNGSDIIKEILEKGYVRANDQGFKAYMDSFIKAFYSTEEKERYLNYSNEKYYEQIMLEKGIGKERN